MIRRETVAVNICNYLAIGCEIYYFLQYHIVIINSISGFSLYSCLCILGVKTVISSIDERLRSLESQDTDECESALEALGQIGSCKYAANCSRLGVIAIS